MLAIFTIYESVWPAAVLNVFWVVFCVVTIGRISLERKNEKKAISKS